MTGGVSRAVSPLAEVPLVRAMWAARGLRQRRLWEASAERQRAALGLAGAALGAGRVLSCAPVRHATGGFFATVAETESGPLFVKGVLSAGREARFWAAWERGAIGAAGVRYRLLPPVRIVRGRLATLLAFPVVPGLDLVRWRRLARYRRHVWATVEAIAEFNARHPAPVPGIGRPAIRASAPVPGARAIAAALKVDAGEAAALAAAARAVEAGWRPVREAAAREAQCLAHMDLGIGNLVFGDGPAILLDFGHAGLAPVGADLHVVLRALEGSGPGPAALAEAYAAAFTAAGGVTDAGTVRRNLETYYGARYRNLGFYTARHAETYRAALATSERLVAARRGP